ncbi:MAG TPA: iron-sulfur cluster repair di-iron protein [Acidimicrobiales bacterium]
MTDIASTSLGDLVATHPGAARVLDGLGLDFCCHGARTLAEACAEAGVDVAAVATELAALDGDGDGDTGWADLDPPDLADHIVATHHRYLWDELPRLEKLATKVADVHGDRHPELAEVHELVGALRADLEPHMLKEERVLFPAIAVLAAGRRDLPFGSAANPIRAMQQEHEHTGELLQRLRAATKGYDVPDDGCASYRALYEGLAALEADTHQHVHKENHVLFPAVLRLEA